MLTFDYDIVIVLKLTGRERGPVLGRRHRAGRVLRWLRGAVEGRRGEQYAAGSQRRIAGMRSPAEEGFGKRRWHPAAWSAAGRRAGRAGSVGLGRKRRAGTDVTEVERDRYPIGFALIQKRTR